MSRAGSLRRGSGNASAPAAGAAFTHRELNLAELVCSSEDNLQSTSQRSRRATPPRGAMSGRHSFKQRPVEDIEELTPIPPVPRDGSMEHQRTSDSRDRVTPSILDNVPSGRSHGSPFPAVKRNNLFGEADLETEGTKVSSVIGRPAVGTISLDDDDLPTLMEHDGAWSTPRPPASQRKIASPAITTPATTLSEPSSDDTQFVSPTWGVFHPPLAAMKAAGLLSHSQRQTHTSSPRPSEGTATESESRTAASGHGSNTTGSVRRGSSRSAPTASRGSSNDTEPAEESLEESAVPVHSRRTSSAIASAASSFASMFRNTRSAATEPAPFMADAPEEGGLASAGSSVPAPSGGSVTRVRPKPRASAQHDEGGPVAMQSNSRRQSGWESNALTPDRKNDGPEIEVNADSMVAPPRDSGAGRHHHVVPRGSAAYEWCALLEEQLAKGGCATEVYLRRGPRDELVRCYVRRHKGFMSGHSTYHLHLSETDTFVLAARKRVRTKTSVFIVSRSHEDLHRDSENCVAKLKANFVGSEYEMSGRSHGKDGGASPKEGPAVRGEAAGVKAGVSARDAAAFGEHVIGMFFKQHALNQRGGPRVMHLAIPVEGDSWRKHADNGGPDTLVRCLELARRREMAPSLEQELLLLATRPAVYNQQTKVYSLDFGGRVRESSVKNFQLVSWDHNSDELGRQTLLQFGKLSEDVFIVDFAYPFSLQTAFAVALASFDSKLVYTF